MSIHRLVQKGTGIVIVEVKAVRPDEDVKAKVLAALMRRWNLRLEEYAADAEVR